MSAVPLPFSLDAPLPAELTGRAQSAFTRYRRYPVFSARWARGRTLVLLGWITVFILLTAVPIGAGPNEPMPYPALAQVALHLVVPLLLGPALGVWVRRRGWPERREGLGLVCAVAATVLLMGAFDWLAAEPMKQWIAERTGLVDASGKRKRIVVMLGVNVQTPGGRVPELPPGGPDAFQHASNALTLGLVSFLLAGGPALWGWRRERDALVALARERELEAERAERHEAELRLSVLAAQVEPHFLFNTLAGVRSAIATDPARAGEMIDRLVEYLRAAIPRLRGQGTAQATLGAQLEIVRAYLGLMNARMPRLSFAVDAPPDLLAARCPPLMLISLAENAVKHGAERKIGPVRIDVGAERLGDGRLRVTVADDGAGFQPEGSGSGIGLANIRERLRQMYGERAALELKAQPAGGVAASLTLPLET